MYLSTMLAISIKDGIINREGAILLLPGILQQSTECLLVMELSHQTPGSSGLRHQLNILDAVL
jgi:hypothetical protein